MIQENSRLGFSHEHECKCPQQNISNKIKRRPKAFLLLGRGDGGRPKVTGKSNKMSPLKKSLFKGIRDAET